MKVVIADASCLILFTNLQRLYVLEGLFGGLWITSVVRAEYRLTLPNFIEVRDPSDTEQLSALSLQLDPGEATSIALAAETANSKLIIDEKKGRRVAIEMGLDVTGTVGVLLEAARADIITLDRELADSLDHYGFHLSHELREMLLSDA